MSAGTLTLTNNSDIVTGIGTSFATELDAGDFVVVTVGGVPYTLPVKSVESDTDLTLVSNFTGPTQSGAAWSAVPRVALNMVTAALVAQSAEALRGLNYDKQNWQQVFSAARNITVKLPDGTTFTGPSWKYLSDNMATKSGGAVPVNQGGTGSTSASGARANLGLGSLATQDSNNVIVSGFRVNGESLFASAAIRIPAAASDTSSGVAIGGFGAIEAGTDTASFEAMSNINIVSWYGIGFCTAYNKPVNGVVAGKPAVFINTRNGTINAKGAVQANGVTLTSDWNAKEEVNIIEPAEALEKIAALDGYTFRYKNADSKRLTAGALAQDLDLVIPDLVIHDEATDYLVADYMGLIGYLIAAVKGLKLQIDEMSSGENLNNSKG